MVSLLSGLSAVPPYHVQNQHVMLPEAAKKVRFLRSDFKRRMEADGKTMTPDERCVVVLVFVGGGGGAVVTVLVVFV